MLHQVKDKLRQRLREERQQLANEVVRQKSTRIVNSCIELIAWDTIRSLHTYLPNEHLREVSTWKLLSYSWIKFRHVKIAVPRIKSLGKFDSVLMEPGTAWQLNEWYLPEPIDGKILKTAHHFDVIIVPVLGFDNAGFRLGYGGGFYDRFLAAQPDAITIGLAYEQGRVDKLPHEDHDMSLKYIITENEIIELSSKY